MTTRDRIYNRRCEEALKGARRLLAANPSLGATEDGAKYLIAGAAIPQGIPYDKLRAFVDSAYILLCE